MSNPQFKMDFEELLVGQVIEWATGTFAKWVEMMEMLQEGLMTLI